MDPDTLAELLSSLREIETHLLYLRKEVEKLPGLSESITNLQIHDVQIGAELSAVSQRMVDVLRRFEGHVSQAGDAPDCKGELGSLKREIRDLTQEVQANKASLAAQTKGDAEVQKEALKQRGQLWISIIALIGSAVASLFALLGSG